MMNDTPNNEGHGLDQHLESWLAELGVRIQQLENEEKNLRLTAEQAAMLSPNDKIQRLLAVTDIERRVREADRVAWALLDEVYARRQEVLAPHALPADEAPHDN